MTDKQKWAPFSNGSEYQIWNENNCAECVKFDYDIQKTCPLEKEISRAAVSDGKIPMWAKDRIGVDNSMSYEQLGNCKEKELF